MATDRQRLEEDLESLYARLLDTRATASAALIAWAKQSYDRIQLLIEAALMEQGTAETLKKREPSQCPAAPMPQRQRVLTLKRSRDPAHSMQRDDATVQSLKRALRVIHADSAKAMDCDLYTRRESEYEDFARFVLSGSQNLAVVSAPAGGGKSAYLWEKIRHPQGLLSHLKTQKLRTVSCNGIVLDAGSLIAAEATTAGDVLNSFHATLAQKIRERFIRHFARRTNVGWAAHVDTVLRSPEDRAELLVVDGTHRLVAAAAALCMRHDDVDAGGRVPRKPTNDASAADLAGNLIDVASKLYRLGLNDIDSALHHLGFAQLDHVFWCRLYAAWFKAEQPLLVIDQMDEVPSPTRVHLVRAIVQFSAVLTAQAEEGAQHWKVILAVRSTMLKDLRSVLWNDTATCIVLSESARSIPRNVTPLCNPVTPRFMFGIVNQRLRRLVEMLRNAPPLASDAVDAAERLSEIFHEQWSLYINGSRQDRALLASLCSSVSVRSAVQSIFATCLHEIYKERHAARLTEWITQWRESEQTRGLILNATSRTRRLWPKQSMNMPRRKLQNRLLTMQKYADSRVLKNSSGLRCIFDHADQVARESLQSARSRSTLMFPEKINRFMSASVARDAWLQLDGAPKRIVSTVGTKLEPIVRVASASTAPMLLGFECLPLGPSGEGLAEILEKCSALDVGALRICLAIAAIETLDRIGNGPAADLNGMADLKFSLNLDSCMIECPLFPSFLMNYLEKMRNKVIFNINEQTSAQCLDSLRRLQGEFDLRFAAYRLNFWRPTVREPLIRRIDMVRLGQRRFEAAMRMQAENPAATLRALRAYVVPGRPLIVEGISDEAQLLFLRSHWDEAQYGELYCHGGGSRLSLYWEQAVQSVMRSDCGPVPSGSTAPSQSAGELSRFGMEHLNYRRH